MGTGVVDLHGNPPAATWSLTVNLFKSKRFRDVSLGLISGQPVCSADAEVQISFHEVCGARMNVRIREADPNEKYVLDLVIVAVDPAGLKRPDQRGPASPVPNGWRRIRSDTTSDWELYNCCIQSLTTSNR